MQQMPQPMQQPMPQIQQAVCGDGVGWAIFDGVPQRMLPRGASWKPNRGSGDPFGVFGKRVVLG